jgi:hypothetical protein
MPALSNSNQQPNDTFDQPWAISTLNHQPSLSTLADPVKTEAAAILHGDADHVPYRI